MLFSVFYSFLVYIDKHVKNNLSMKVLLKTFSSVMISSTISMTILDTMAKHIIVPDRIEKKE